MPPWPRTAVSRYLPSNTCPTRLPLGQAPSACCPSHSRQVRSGSASPLPLGLKSMAFALAAAGPRASAKPTVNQLGPATSHSQIVACTPLGDTTTSRLTARQDCASIHHRDAACGLRRLDEQQQQAAHDQERGRG